MLRRGRLSGDPDVLEYYRSKHSSKPLRVIDLSECAVWQHAGPGFVRKEFQNHFVFIVKTTSRTFYLVAKTEEEMQVWVHSISQVCNLGRLEDRAGESGAGGAGGPREQKGRDAPRRCCCCCYCCCSVPIVKPCWELRLVCCVLGCSVLAGGKTERGGLSQAGKTSS